MFKLKVKFYFAIKDKINLGSNQMEPQRHQIAFAFKSHLNQVASKAINSDPDFERAKSREFGRELTNAAPQTSCFSLVTSAKKLEN
jgi:hypothetical protein